MSSSWCVHFCQRDKFCSSLVSDYTRGVTPMGKKWLARNGVMKSVLWATVLWLEFASRHLTWTLNGESASAISKRCTKCSLQMGYNLVSVHSHQSTYIWISFCLPRWVLYYRLDVSYVNQGIFMLTGSRNGSESRAGRSCAVIFY